MTEYAKLRQQLLNDMRSKYGGEEMINATEAAHEYGRKRPENARQFLDLLHSMPDGKSGRRLYPIGDIASDKARRMLWGEKA